MIAECGIFVQVFVILGRIGFQIIEKPEREFWIVHHKVIDGGR